MDVNEEQVAETEEAEVDIAALAAEFGGSDDEEAKAEEPVAEAAPDEDKPPVEPAEEAPPAELQSPYLVKIAELEAKHREELANREQGFTAKQEETKASVIAEMKRNPLAFFEQHGFTAEDAEDLALHAYRHKLGDEAPEELVKRTAKSDLDRRFIEQERKFAELEAKLEQKEVQIEAQRVLTSIEDFASKIPESMPYLAGEEANDIVNDIAVLYAEIARTGRKPSISECAQLLETQHAKLAQKYTKQSTATPAPKIQANEPEETITIDNESLNDRSTAKKADMDTSDEDILKSIQNQITKGGFGSLT